MSFKDWEQLREEEKNSALATKSSGSSISSGGGGMGAGGGAMADAFVDLGDKLHKNFSANMDSAFQNRQARNSLNENKRQFGIEALLKKQQMQQDQGQFDRSSGMKAIDLLANIRAGNMQQFGRSQLKNAYFKL